MKFIYIFAFFLAFTASCATAKLGATDAFKTGKGNLLVKPITHGAVVLTWDKKTIYVDPYGGAEAYAGVAAPDLILITDIHGDHLDQKTLDGLQTANAALVVPKAVADKLPDNLRKNMVVLQNGEDTNLHGIEIQAVPMYNLPETENSMHPKGRGNGYILDLAGTKVYLSGDTEDTQEMRALQGIDVAFVCMNLPYTMDIEQAASAVLEFKPKVVYPYHYRGQGGLSDVAAFRKMVNDKDKSIDVRVGNWYPQQ